MMFIFNRVVFRFHVRFGGCTVYTPHPTNLDTPPLSPLRWSGNPQRSREASFLASIFACLKMSYRSGVLYVVFFLRVKMVNQQFPSLNH